MALTPKVGTEYVLTASDGIGQGIGALAPGQRVVVESLHKEPEAGVGGNVVVSFPGPPVVVEGEEIFPVRRVSLSTRDFKSSFELAGDN